jgi:hypothetical protein
MSSQNKNRLVASCPATATSPLGSMELLREKVDEELAGPGRQSTGMLLTPNLNTAYLLSRHNLIIGSQ